MFYIFDSLGKNIATCDFEPDREDLSSRDEIAIEYHETVNGELQLIDGEIKVIEVVQSLESKQTQVWKAIKQKRYNNVHSGCYIKSVDKWFHSDESSRIQYLALITLPSLPDNLQWKTMDNSFITLTRPLLTELTSAMLLKEQQDFMNAEQHKQRMMQADNPLDYDYSTGWSETYQER